MSTNSPLKGNTYLLFIMIWQILITFAVPLIENMSGFQLLSSQLSIIPLHLILFILPFALYLAITSQKTSDVLPLKKISFANIGLIVLMCVTIQPLMMVLSGLMAFIFPNNVSTAMSELYSLPIYITLIATALTPAITEEITMRGVLLTNYKSLEIKKAAFMNGLLFGLLHLDLQQLPYAFMLGFLFAYFVYYTKSIFASIVGHFTINFFQTALAYLSLSIIEHADQSDLIAESSQVTPVAQASDTSLLSAIVSLSVIALIFTPVFIIIYRAFVSYNRRRLVDDAFVDTSDASSINSICDFIPENSNSSNLSADNKSNRIINWPFIAIICIYVFFTLFVFLIT